MSSEVNITLNGSLLEEGILSDGADDTDYLNDYDLRWEIFHYFNIFIVLCKIIILALALASDIYLIVIINKYKNLQNRINNYIMQYAIYNILYLVLVNLIIIIGDVSGLRIHMNYCFVSNVDHLFITMCFYVVTFMAIDWYVLNFHFNIYEMYPKIFKYGVFGLAIPQWITTSIICLVNEKSHVHKVRLHLVAISLMLCFVTVCCITILKGRKTISMEAQKTEYALSIPRMILILSFFPFVAPIFSYILANDVSRVIVRFLFSLEEITDGIFFATPIIILCQLTKSNKYFKSAYIKSCRRKTVQNYTDDNLDTDSVNQVPQNVGFERNSEVIHF